MGGRSGGRAAAGAARIGGEGGVGHVGAILAARRVGGRCAGGGGDELGGTGEGVDGRLTCLFLGVLWEGVVAASHARAGPAAGAGSAGRVINGGTLITRRWRRVGGREGGGGAAATPWQPPWRHVPACPCPFPSTDAAAWRTRAALRAPDRPLPTDDDLPRRRGFGRCAVAADGAPLRRRSALRGSATRQRDARGVLPRLDVGATATEGAPPRRPGAAATTAAASGGTAVAAKTATAVPAAVGGLCGGGRPASGDCHSCGGRGRRSSGGGRPCCAGATATPASVACAAAGPRRCAMARARRPPTHRRSPRLDAVDGPALAAHSVASRPPRPGNAPAGPTRYAR